MKIRNFRIQVKDYYPNSSKQPESKTFKKQLEISIKDALEEFEMELMVIEEISDVNKD